MTIYPRGSLKTEHLYSCHSLCIHLSLTMYLSGETSEWGEHEIDYVFFVQADVEYKANPEEVQDAKYVTHGELQAMMEASSGLLWSPWFRIIAQKFLPEWWDNLEATLHSDRFVEYEKIYRFDPAPQFFGGAGRAEQWLGAAEDFVYSGR